MSPYTQEIKEKQTITRINGIKVALLEQHEAFLEMFGCSAHLFTGQIQSQHSSSLSALQHMPKKAQESPALRGIPEESFHRVCRTLEEEEELKDTCMLSQSSSFFSGLSSTMA